MNENQARVSQEEENLINNLRRRSPNCRPTEMVEAESQPRFMHPDSGNSFQLEATSVRGRGTDPTWTTWGYNNANTRSRGNPYPPTTSQVPALFSCGSEHIFPWSHNYAKLANDKLWLRLGFAFYWCLSVLTDCPRLMKLLLQKMVCKWKAKGGIATKTPWLVLPKMGATTTIYWTGRHHCGLRSSGQRRGNVCVD